MHACIHPYIHTYICIYIYRYVYIHIHVHIYIYSHYVRYMCNDIFFNLWSLSQCTAIYLTFTRNCEDLSCAIYTHKQYVLSGLLLRWAVPMFQKSGRPFGKSQFWIANKHKPTVIIFYHLQMGHGFHSYRQGEVRVSKDDATALDHAVGWAGNPICYLDGSGTADFPTAILIGRIWKDDDWPIDHDWPLDLLSIFRNPWNPQIRWNRLSG